MLANPTGLSAPVKPHVGMSPTNSLTFTPSRPMAMRCSAKDMSRLGVAGKVIWRVTKPSKAPLLGRITVARPNSFSERINCPSSMTVTVASSMLTLPVTSTTPSTFKEVLSAAVKDDNAMSAPKFWVAPMPLATKCADAIWGKAFEDKKWPSKVNVMPFKSIKVPEGETSTELASASVTNDTSWLTTTLSSPPGTQSQDHVTGSLQMPR